MKRILLFTTLLLCIMKASAQIKNYEADWKKVDALWQQQNLPKSALTEVKKILAKAKKEKQEAQIIKSLVYLTGLQERTRENNLPQSINEVEAELKVHSGAAQAILQSMLAGQYWSYLQNNRWKFYNRTNTTAFKKEDIATWTLEDFHRRISELFLASLRNERLLQQTSLTPYEAIINKGNVRHLRPTLYDLLAHRALDYFRNDERDLKKPAYAFQINQAEAFAPAPQFAAHSFRTNDSLSLHNKALTIYQELIRFHLNDEKKDALIDVDAGRIQFVYDHSVHEAKDSLYEAALKQALTQYGRQPATHQLSYLLAAYYNGQGETYSPFGDTAHRYKKIAAKEILEAVVRDSANKKSEGWVNSYNLLQELNKQSFSFEVEKVNVPAQPFRALVKYTNSTLLYFRLIKATEELKKAMENEDGDEKYWTAVTKATPLKSWQQPLPSTQDLQEHNVEIKIEALPVGEYFLLAASAPDFNKDKTQLGGQFFHVSNISYINQGRDYFVLHRESGQPLVKATVTVFTGEYDYRTSRYTKAKAGTFTTNDRGYFQIDLSKNERRRDQYFLDISHNGDRLKLEEYNYDYYSYDERRDNQKPVTRIFFFTDRAIYRPGQTAYFKGIAVNGTGEGSKVAEGFKTKIYLRNANYQLTDSLELTTNDYGSFHGKFVLPQGVLNGQFSITDKEGRNTISFSVEEYKRPKFAVAFEKIKESYKAGDSITITGTAKAYAGNNIDGAKVVYRVVRQPRFLYPWLFWRGWFPRAEPMEIAHGETITAGDGKFTIRFHAIPDLKLDKKWEPVFDYEVHADVTDINGETRSGETTVSAGYKSLVMKVTLPEKVMKDSLRTIGVVTENMNGSFQPARVQVTFTKLIPENRLIRKRYWQQPDQFVMSKEAFVTAFPHDEYRNETEPKTWEKGEVVLTFADSTREGKELAVSSGQLAVGHYEVTFTTKDKDGQEVKDVKFVELFDAAKPFTTPQYLWAVGSKGLIEPGQTTQVQIGSSAENVFLVSQVDKRRTTLQAEEDGPKKASSFEFTSLNKEKKTFSYTPTEADRGGFGVNYFFVKDNRFYQFGDVIDVPWSNKELKIEYATFRDKTLPGSEEKWKVKISGSKGDAVAAEMLASMYDASLDQFQMHQWNRPGLWPVYFNQPSWGGTKNFNSVTAQQNNIDPRNIVEWNIKYDELLLSPGDHNRHLFEAYFGNLGAATRMQKRGEVDANGVMNMSVQKVEMTKFTPPVIARDEEGQADSSKEIWVQGGLIKKINETKAKDNTPIQPRRNFNETAFFFPDLKTDPQGNIEFSFTTPEALTKWKLQTLAHTKTLAFGFSQKELITQKELMAQPNAPRFLRQGDQMEFPVKLVNLTDKEITGQVQLELFDAASNQPVDGWFMNTFPNQYFTVAAGGSEVANFPIQVPYQFASTLTWRVTARSQNLSDGEENILPVLTNKILVTETLPLPMKTAGTKTFSFDKLKQAGNSETLQHQSLTVEYTSNPVWLAVQALPYLMEYPYDCAEQTWNRYYANALATKIVQSAPRIKAVFEKWSTADTAALLSNLQKNQELKSAILEETPWVLQAQSETQQKKNIALLFDLVRMSKEQKSALTRLQNMQAPNGGFVWFQGGPDDRYITQYILSGIGHLKKLGGDISDLKIIISKALPYLDKKIAEDYNRLIKSKADLKKQYPDYTAIQYLYMRSFFPESKMEAAAQKAADYYRTQAQQYWTKQGLYAQGMIALALHRTGNTTTAQAIVRSLKENSINHEELGRYWINNSFGKSWFWYQAPIETQALMIEAFTDISKDGTTVNELRTWLLKNKQTTAWRTTKATADACYALLLQGTDWLANEPSVRIQLGNATINNTQGAEAGTGYIKQSIPVKNITPETGNITVTVMPQTTPTPNTKPQTPNPSWGAVYWQYFEDMNKVTTAATPLQLHKKLFVEKKGDRGPVLSPVNEGSELHVGDKVVVRIELRVDRDMEYVHMKDLRASALEPVNVLSGYKWQGGLSYYETTRDASTNFFFSYLRKGTYVFEYPLFVQHKGSFSNGITTIQCMYAPEFSAHSEGVKVVVE